VCSSDLGRAGGKGFGHWSVFVTDDPVIAKQPPGQSDGVGLGQGSDQRRQSVISGVNVDELIDIQRQDPVGVANDIHPVCQLQRGELNAALVIRPVVTDMRQLTQSGQVVQHLTGAVLTIVREHQEIGEPHCTVMRQPFQQKGCFISNRKDCQEFQSVTALCSCYDADRPLAIDRVPLHASSVLIRQR